MLIRKRLAVIFSLSRENENYETQMNKLSDEKRAMILKALVEGNSIRATSRLTGTSKNTVSRLLKNVGTYCMDRHDALVRDVESERVQCDEIWSFCGAKERNVPKDEKHQGRGDVWTWTALCQDSKLMIAYRVGCRGARDRRAVHAGSR